jgi:hypothetical protein
LYHTKRTAQARGDDEIQNEQYKENPETDSAESNPIDIMDPKSISQQTDTNQQPKHFENLQKRGDAISP